MRSASEAGHPSSVDAPLFVPSRFAAGCLVASCGLPVLSAVSAPLRAPVCFMPKRSLTYFVFPALPGVRSGASFVPRCCGRSRWLPRRLSHAARCRFPRPAPVFVLFCPRLRPVSRGLRRRRPPGRTFTAAPVRPRSGPGGRCSPPRGPGRRAAPFARA